MVKSEQSTRLEIPTLLQHSSSQEYSPAAPNSKKKLKGVRMRSWGSWVSEIRAPHQKARIWLGSYSTPEAAARAYDAALICIKGPAAAASSLNFPIDSSQYPNTTNDTPPMMSPKSIQRIAASAAAAAADLPLSQQQAPSPPLSEDDFSIPFADLMNEPIGGIDSWCSFESPKYIDLMMVNGMQFDFAPSTMVDDFLYEEGEIRLWDFC